MPQIDIAALIVALTGVGAFAWSVVQAIRGRKDTHKQQEAANELANREQHWDELVESKSITDADNRHMRGEIQGLRAELRERDNLINRHRIWDYKAILRMPDDDLGDPPNLYP